VTNIYSSFALNWRSNDLPLSDLPKKIDNNYDINIVNESPDLWPHIASSIADTNFLKVNENDLRLEVNNIGLFRASNGNNISWYKLFPQVDDKDIKTFLLGSMFGAILIQRGLLLMHGNALEKDGKTIACLGFSGSGKSTLAYALLRNGWKFLTDDLVAIDNDGFILTGIPRLKLWEDSLKAYGLKKEKLTSVRNNLNKFIYKPDDKSISKQKTKLTAFYLVNRFSTNENSSQVTIKRIIDEKIKFLYLRNNLYRPRFVRGLKKEGKIFKKLVALQKTVPVSVLNLPNKVDSLIDSIKRVDL